MMEWKTIGMMTVFLVLGTLEAFGGVVPFSYQTNAKLERDRDPINDLIMEDNVAGAIGRFAATANSGVQWAKKGYHHTMGSFDFRLQETNAPSLGVRTVLEWKLIGDLLKLSVENAVPLQSPSNPVQSAHLILQVHL